MTNRSKHCSVLLILLFATATVSPQSLPNESGVTRATLDNGLRVVIIRDPLAPVVTVEDNYLVGANETPPGFPGMAHAQEHMAFRGCAGVPADQTAAIFASSAATATPTPSRTSRSTSPPCRPRIWTSPCVSTQRACRTSRMPTAEWAHEKGAIEQEVARDLSEPVYKFLTRLNEDMFSGTPYAHDALGTRDSFEKTTGEMLKTFYRNWYTPNNAVLVVAGDVDPAETLSRMSELYGPDRPQADWAAAERLARSRQARELLRSTATCPTRSRSSSYRLPGTDSADFAADAHHGRRAREPARRHLRARAGREGARGAIQLAETYPKASVGFAYAVLTGGNGRRRLSSRA